MANKYVVLIAAFALFFVTVDLNAQTVKGKHDTKPSETVTTQTAVTKDGRSVILKSDGTWKYSDEQSSSQSIKSPWQEPTIQTVQRGGFTFELKQAKMAGGNVTFYFVVTSHEENRTLDIINSYVGQESLMWDNLGNRYVGKRNTLGNIRDGRMEMVPELPTKATITFEGVSSEASTVASLKITFWMTAPEASDWIGIEFRRIPLTQ